MNSSVHQLFRQQTVGKKKRERTRGALLDSAISVFANKGYEGLESAISRLTQMSPMARFTTTTKTKTNFSMMLHWAWRLKLRAALMKK